MRGQHTDGRRQLLARVEEFAPQGAELPGEEVQADGAAPALPGFQRVGELPRRTDEFTKALQRSGCAGGVVGGGQQGLGDIPAVPGDVHVVDQIL